MPHPKHTRTHIHTYFLLIIYSSTKHAHSVSWTQTQSNYPNLIIGQHFCNTKHWWENVTRNRLGRHHRSRSRSTGSKRKDCDRDFPFFNSGLIPRASDSAYVIPVAVDRSTNSYRRLKTDDWHTVVDLAFIENCCLLMKQKWASLHSMLKLEEEKMSMHLALRGRGWGVKCCMNVNALDVLVTSVVIYFTLSVLLALCYVIFFGQWEDRCSTPFISSSCHRYVLRSNHHSFTQVYEKNVTFIKNQF